ncbi:MAG: hypothetical protein RMK99_03535 [Anaerolineales bacterium]|nr:hypothetical protein [Anaerolineales bacterium]
MKKFALPMLALLLAACAPLSLPEPTMSPGQPDPTTSLPEIVMLPPDNLPQPTATPLPPADALTLPLPQLMHRPPEPATVPPTPAPVVGELPATLRESIEADLEQRTGVSRSAFTYLRAEAIVWNDGSLGCPQPGMMYTQALVPGYWVVIRAGDAEFDYRAAESGYFILCEPKRPRP